MSLKMLIHFISQLFDNSVKNASPFTRRDFGFTSACFCMGTLKFEFIQNVDIEIRQE